MTQPGTPARTYALAMLMSVGLNLGAIGTFATVDLPQGPAPTAFGSSAAVAPIVLTDLSATPPRSESAKADESAPPKAERATPEMPELEPPVPKDVPRVRLGNPDAPESDSRVWLGSSKPDSPNAGQRGTLDQGDFRPGEPGSPGGAQPTPASPRPPMPNSESPVRPPRLNRPIEEAPPSELPPAPPAATSAQPRSAGAERQPVDTQAVDGESKTTPDLSRSARLERLDSPTIATDGSDVERPAVPPPTVEDLFAASVEASRSATARAARNLQEAILRAAQPLPQDVADRADVAPLAAPMPDQASAARAQPPQPSPPPPNLARAASRPGGENGNRADRESQAFTTSDQLVVRPGQPLAARGLSIKTVAPRWTTATRVLYRFRNPVVRVKFARSGKVLSAEYLPGKDAGHPDVSGPLRDAVLRWTAAGEELLKIPADDPNAGITLEFKIVLTD